MTGASFSPTNPIVGSDFTAYVTVNNIGDAAGSGGFLDAWANRPDESIAAYVRHLLEVRSAVGARR